MVDKQLIAGPVLEPLRIFVASSTEGEKTALEIASTLSSLFDGRARVEPWGAEFPVGRTAIEALETIAEDVDFAVVVMTPDDLIKSRAQESVAPRDNLIFELGLFIGSLGRDRSFIALDPRSGLKLPSDVLNLTWLPFDSASPDKLRASLRKECAKLAAQMENTGPRPKWLAQGRAALLANSGFRREVEGVWWEKINFPDGSAISLFAINPDPLTGGVMLNGTGYGVDGSRTALWKSEMVRIYPSDRRLAYLWRGSHPEPGEANLKFHGYGTMEFVPPEPPSEISVGGAGDFWDVDEAAPVRTVCKPIELRRVQDQSQVESIALAAQPERSALIRDVLRRW